MVVVPADPVQDVVEVDWTASISMTGSPGTFTETVATDADASELAVVASVVTLAQSTVAATKPPRFATHGVVVVELDEVATGPVSGNGGTLTNCVVPSRVALAEIPNARPVKTGAIPTLTVSAPQGLDTVLLLVSPL